MIKKNINFIKYKIKYIHAALDGIADASHHEQDIQDAAEEASLDVDGILNAVNEIDALIFGTWDEE